MPMITSNTSHARSFTDIYRLFISNTSPDFFGVIILAQKFLRYSKRQIVGSIAYFPGGQPPPTPSPDASNKHINLGPLMTNYFAVVGSRSPPFSSVLQYWNACFEAGKPFHQTIRGFTCRIVFIGVIKIFPVGTAVAACRIFQSIFRFV